MERLPDGAGIAAAVGWGMLFYELAWRGGRLLLRLL